MTEYNTYVQIWMPFNFGLLQLQWVTLDEYLKLYEGMA